MSSELAGRRVVVAMSGGVDSSVTAAVLKEQGYEVIGVTMQLWPREDTAPAAGRSCCSLSAIQDARRVAHMLHIPHYVLNLREDFEQAVIAPFCHAYQQGLTPNPCIDCNRVMKFDILLQRARQMGAAYIATGHYSQIMFDTARSAYVLTKGIDARKDQSYFLYTLTQEQLQHTLMPLGGMTKEQTRILAGHYELPVAEKQESQDICFVDDGAYAAFVEAYTRQPAQTGPMYDMQGHLLGMHKGLIHYTIGQRQGLGLGGEGPWYVIALRQEDNSIIVGNDADVYRDQLVAEPLHRIIPDEQIYGITYTAKIRYNHPGAVCVATPTQNGRAYIHFDQPQRAISPGQSVVLYDGDRVVAGGVIKD